MGQLREGAEGIPLPDCSAPERIPVVTVDFTPTGAVRALRGAGGEALSEPAIVDRRYLENVLFVRKNKRGSLDQICDT